MRNVLFRARESFAQDQRGNVAILFAFTAIPLIALLGGAVDVTRHQRHEMALLNAMDAATIALVRQGELSDAEADKFVNDFIGAIVESKDDPMLHMASFDATKIEGGYRVSSKGTMDTAFLPVVGMDAMSLNLSTEVMESTGKYEIALALDNTGSMDNHGRIEALRDAAAQLVDDLYKEPGTKDRVEMALVPFVTTVNVKSTTADVFQDSWIDYVGPSQDIDGKTVYGFNFLDPDPKAKPVSREKLFKQMGVTWKGCVEARADEDNDNAPTSSATRWAPYLWPDEPDNRGYGNSYLKDVTTAGTSDWDLLRNTAKYAVKAGTKVSDTSSKGPNAACPRPIVELTNDTDRMKAEIAAMKPYNEGNLSNNSGTNVSQGLLWGWRVLSPTAPFEEGAEYSDKETTKVLVLLSDGRNQIVPNNDDTRSDYNSYNYLAAGRLGSTNDFRVAERTVDAKVAKICADVKGTGIRVYTILFQVDFDETQDLFRECASKDDNGEPLYFYVPDAGSLETAFAEIGEDLTSLRVAR